MLITVKLESVLTFVALLNNVLFILPFSNFWVRFSASKTHDGFAAGLHDWASYQLYRFYSIICEQRLMLYLTNATVLTIVLESSCNTRLLFALSFDLSSLFTLDHEIT